MAKKEVKSVVADKCEQIVEIVESPKTCVVCSGEVAPNSTEGLCWVCRRLKISAWADSDNQAPSQE